MVVLEALLARTGEAREQPDLPDVVGLLGRALEARQRLRLRDGRRRAGGPRHLRASSRPRPPAGHRGVPPARARGRRRHHRFLARGRDAAQLRGRLRSTAPSASVWSSPARSGRPARKWRPSSASCWRPSSVPASAAREAGPAARAPGAHLPGRLRGRGLARRARPVRAAQAARARETSPCCSSARPGVGKELLARIAPRLVAPAPRSVRGHQLRGHPRGPARGRDVRHRQGRGHGRGGAPREVPDGRGGHAAPRRDRGHAPGAPGQAAARAPGEGGPARRRRAGDGGHPRHRRHQLRPPAPHGGRPLPPRPLLPRRGLRPARPSPARAAGGHPGAGRGLHARRRAGARQDGARIHRQGAARARRATPGRGTSASSSTRRGGWWHSARTGRPSTPP